MHILSPHQGVAQLTGKPGSRVGADKMYLQGSEQMNKYMDLVRFSQQT